MGNKREHVSNTGINREHWEQWRSQREHRTQSGTHSKHTENNRGKLGTGHISKAFLKENCSQCVTSVISTVRDVPSVYPIFPYCSQYVSSVFPIVSGVPSVISIVPSVPY